MSRSTGKTAAMNLHHFFRFRDGKIAYYRGSEDTAQTEAALRASPGLVPWTSRLTVRIWPVFAQQKPAES
jgi:hypothetical protein